MDNTITCLSQKFNVAQSIIYDIKKIILFYATTSSNSLTKQKTLKIRLYCKIDTIYCKKGLKVIKQ